MDANTVTIVYKSYHNQCAEGGGCEGGLMIHHIKFKSRGGSNRPENLVLLCALHHTHQHDGTSDRWSLNSWEDEPDAIPWKKPRRT